MKEGVWVCWMEGGEWKGVLHPYVPDTPYRYYLSKSCLPTSLCTIRVNGGPARIQSYAKPGDVVLYRKLSKTARSS